MLEIIKATIISLLITGNSYAQDASDNSNEDDKITKIKVQTIAPITINKTKHINAKFLDLKDSAIEQGIDDIFIIGKIKYQTNINNGWTTININWIGLENSKLNTKKYIKLEKPAVSKLLTDDKKIDPLQEITIKVDKDILMAGISTMQQEKQEKETVKLDDKTIKSLTEKQNSTTLAGSNKTTTPISTLPDSQLNATEVTTSQVTKECSIRYDIENSQAYQQQRLDTVDSNGNTTVVGTCLDTGESYTLIKRYGSPCRVLADPVQDIIYQSYRVISTINNTEQIIRDCQVDYASNTIAVITTTDQCTPIHDLAIAISHETSRKYYLLDGANVHLTNCTVNGTTYTHEKSVCSYDLQVSDSFAIPQVKTYITLSDNSELTVQNCTTESSTQLPIVYKECTGSQRYSHDFSSQISYLNKEKWVQNPYDNNNLVKINDCQISATTFTHLETTTGCTPIYEDHNLLTNQRYKTYIEDGTATIYLDTICGNSYQIPYTPATITLSNNGDTKTKQYIRLDGTVYDRIETTTSVSFTTSGNHTWTVPNNITQIYVVVKGSDGESALSYQCYVYGIDGQSSQIAINNTTISALGGTGSRGYRYKGECINQSAATTGQIKTSYINVIAGQTGSITIGTINAYVTIKY